jgi:hypothetical protein
VIYSAAMPINDYVTIAEALEDERIPYTAYWLGRLAKAGKVKAKKIGTGFRGYWLIYLPSLLKYTKEMEDLGTKKHGGG